MRTEAEKARRVRSVVDNLKDSMLMLVMFAFMILYAAAFAGKLDPIRDNTLLLRIEPIILILIGFFCGRLPSRQNEMSLKDEINRQFHAAEAAQFAKAKAELERETLEEKIKNASALLKQGAVKISGGSGESEKAAIRAAAMILEN